MNSLNVRDDDVHHPYSDGMGRSLTSIEHRLQGAM